MKWRLDESKLTSTGKLKIKENLNCIVCSKWWFDEGKRLKGMIDGNFDCLQCLYLSYYSCQQSTLYHIFCLLRNPFRFWVCLGFYFESKSSGIFLRKSMLICHRSTWSKATEHLEWNMIFSAWFFYRRRHIPFKNLLKVSTYFFHRKTSTLSSYFKIISS